MGAVWVYERGGEAADGGVVCAAVGGLPDGRVRPLRRRRKGSRRAQAHARRRAVGSAGRRSLGVPRVDGCRRVALRLPTCPLRRQPCDQQGRRRRVSGRHVREGFLELQEGREAYGRISRLLGGTVRVVARKRRDGE